MVPLTGLEPVLWKPERDFKSRVSTYSTTTAYTVGLLVWFEENHTTIPPDLSRLFQLIQISGEGFQAIFQEPGHFLPLRSF